MTATGVQQMEQNIARCRLVLSIAAMVAVYVDPTEPLLSRWVPLVSGPFVMDHRLTIIMTSHLIYSACVYVSLRREWLLPERVAMWTMWVDVLFGAAIGTLTEGVTSPSYVFFAFAVVAAALRAGLRQTIVVTALTVGLYGCLILISTRGSADVYIMRPVYLAITGYLVGYLGQQRLELQEEMRRLEGLEQRHRIGRDLHDNFAQALAGIDLRLEGCRKQLQANPGAEVLTALTELQKGVKREFDELRSYTRTLAGLELTTVPAGVRRTTQLSINAEVSGSVDLIDHILQITREGINNMRHHADASTGTVAIHADGDEVHISIEDDGVGFRVHAPPWSIASRVSEIGGRIQVVDTRGRGAQLLITVPQG